MNKGDLIGEVAKVVGTKKEAQESTRFESSDISFDSGKHKRMAKYEEALSNLARHISIRRDEIALYLRQIDQLNDRMNHYDQMIRELR